MKHPQVVLDGLTTPTLIYTVHNPYVPNPLSMQVIDKIKNLVPQVECCIFGSTPVLKDREVNRNSVAIFDGGTFYGSRRFTFLVIGKETRLPRGAEWARGSQWGVAVSPSCSAARIINCASMIAAHFVANFSIEEIEKGNYPWGPRKTAKRKPRRNAPRPYHQAHAVCRCGFYDHMLSQ